MRLAESDLSEYRDRGYLFLSGRLRREIVEAVISEFASLGQAGTTGRVLEQDSKTLRSIYGAHTSNVVLGRFTRLRSLVEPARQALGSDVYIHQFKMNAKAAFGGDVWEWHQDYVFWRNEDGMPSARVINVLIFLDEVNEFNGPLLLIPASHKEEGNPAGQKRGRDVMKRKGTTGGPRWGSDVAAKLKYSLTRDIIARLVAQHGIVAPKGPPGSVLIFDANICHGSAPNMSPFDRRVAIITYNSVDNVPLQIGERRPEFLAGRHYDAIATLDDADMFEQSEMMPG